MAPPVASIRRRTLPTGATIHSTLREQSDSESHELRADREPSKTRKPWARFGANTFGRRPTRQQLAGDDIMSCSCQHRR
jgi:hypothetical protein